jgi:hypothetical protein
MIQESTAFTTIFRLKKCYFRYNFSCKRVLHIYRVFHNSRPREKEETGDRIWMCNFEEKKI